MTLRIEYLPIDELIPYARNMNDHSDEHVAELAASIKEFGWTNPPLIDKDSVLVAGHGRILAARQLGIMSIPCIRRDHWTPDQVKAYRIADNRLPKNATVNTVMLSAELMELKAAEFELGLLGFDESELHALLNPEVAEPKKERGDPEEVPEIVDTRCKPGDLWILGKHRILCGDSTNVQHVERLMAGEKADICFTSPPYNAGKPFTNRNSGPLKASFYQSHNDNMESGDYIALLSGSLSNALISSRYAFFNLQFLNGNKVSLAEWLHNHREQLVDVIVAVKTNAVPAFHPGQLNCGFEMVFAFGERSDTRSFSDCCFRQGSRSNVFEYPKDTEKELTGVHDARFPVAFAEQFVTAFAQRSVLDLFLGSGSTLIACEKTSRRCFGMELDPKYCDVILARWEKYTGLTAELEEAD